MGAAAQSKDGSNPHRVHPYDTQEDKSAMPYTVLSSSSVTCWM